MTATKLYTYHVTCDGRTPDNASDCASQSMVTSNGDDLGEKLAVRGWRVEDDYRKLAHATHYRPPGVMYLCPGHHSPNSDVPQEDSGENHG